MTSTTQTTATQPPAAASSAAPTELTHRQILEVMTGILAALFTALLSSTIVSTALPTIMSDLNGTQRQYTWVITASLLAMTISTPIWGKLSDLFSKKLLIQLSIVVFVIGSIGAGFSQSVPPMMAFRAVQGLGMGGLTALAQSIIGSIIPPRQRGRYSGYMGAVMAVSTVSGPLLGGVITDHVNWRWCFFVCVPLAVGALILLQKTLHLSHVRRHVKIDYLGALLLAIAAALPMLWVTFAGSSYGWISWQTAIFLGGFVGVAGLAVVVELKVDEPMVPVRILRNSTTALMIVASLGVGVALFGSSTFMTQYFQLAGGHTPTRAGLMTIPLIVAQMLASTIGGQLVSRTGRWKPLMVFGSILMVGGLVGLGFTDHTTPYWHFAIFMAILGIGVGTLVQNIVLAVQNTVDVSQIGASSATISFFRSLGGAVGVSILGAVLADHVTSNVATGLRSAGISSGGSPGGSLNLDALPAPVVAIVRSAYGDSFGLLFAIAAGVSVLTLVAVIAVHEVPLRTTIELKPSPQDGPRLTDPEPEHVLDAHASADRSLNGSSNGSPVNGHDRLAPVPVRTVPTPNEVELNSLDDPNERISVAALDVLTAAQDQARQHLVASRSSHLDVAERLDEAGREVDAAVARFHAELDQIKQRLTGEHRGVSVGTGGTDGSGGDSLRSYEYGLLVNAQRTAQKVTTLARTEAERILTNADEEVTEIEKRIATLRQVEQELSAKLASSLR
ncbi:MAG: MFS transporter [Propionibacteriaceae bacterium]